jgi:hypothetical protein
VRLLAVAVTRPQLRGLAHTLAQRHGGAALDWLVVVDAYSSAVPDATETETEWALGQWWQADQSVAEDSPLHSDLGSSNGDLVRKALLRCAGSHSPVRLLAAVLFAQVSAERTSGSAGGAW